jgi:coenzyme PQQ precursor peptide PqqA
VICIDIIAEIFLHNQETIMKWMTPAAQDMRFGFEITMYIANR